MCSSDLIPIPKGKLTKEQFDKLIESGEDDATERLEVWEKDPSVQAFTDLLNRALDKPKEQEQEAALARAKADADIAIKRWIAEQQAAIDAFNAENQAKLAQAKLEIDARTKEAQVQLAEANLQRVQQMNRRLARTVPASVVADTAEAAVPEPAVLLARTRTE